MAPQRLAQSDLARRAREKAEMRERDARLLASGEVSREQLSQRNGLFSKLDMKKVRVVGRVSMGRR
ncbi:MAG TPA: hypothetical protein VLL76_06115 [Candidatus Omnitrophota bacterium]|nr:hypothetical protein [Candidatus Omnitrophota bacterium]